MQLSDGTTMPKLTAHPGERVVVEAGNPRLTSEVLGRFVGLGNGRAGQIVVGGTDLSAVGPRDLRALVGYAAQGMMLARGSVSRTVGYRCPGTSPEQVNWLLAQVDMAERVAQLPKGAETVLVQAASL